MVKVVILDVDGTLMDTNYLHVEAWAQAFRALGREIPRSVIHAQIGKGSDQMLPEFIPDEAEAERANKRHSEIYGELEQHGYPLPGAVRLLDYLKERGLATWLATSAKPDELERTLKVLRADGKLTGVVCSDDVEASKPAGDIFHVTLQRAGCAPAEAIVVGDTIWDVLAAKKAGLRTVGVDTGGYYHEAALREAGAVAVYADCNALMKARFPDGL